MTNRLLREGLESYAELVLQIIGNVVDGALAVCNGEFAGPDVFNICRSGRIGAAIGDRLQFGDFNVRFITRRNPLEIGLDPCRGLRSYGTILHANVKHQRKGALAHDAELPAPGSRDLH